MTIPNVPVLQATIARGGRSRRIPVYKPNAKFDLPHIPLSFLEALSPSLGGMDGVTCEEDFPLLVVDARGRVKYTLTK